MIQKTKKREDKQVKIGSLGTQVPIGTQVPLGTQGLRHSVVSHSVAPASEPYDTFSVEFILNDQALYFITLQW